MSIKPKKLAKFHRPSQIFIKLGKMN